MVDHKPKIHHSKNNIAHYSNFANNVNSPFSKAKRLNQAPHDDEASKSAQPLVRHKLRKSDQQSEPEYITQYSQDTHLIKVGEDYEKMKKMSS